MCNNRRTWMFHIVLVAAVLLAVTAPLVRQVSCVANPPVAADKAANTFESLSHLNLTKRDVGNVLDTASPQHNDDGDGDGDGDGGHVSSSIRDMDFDSYVNEFNMQDEASIPEDILDQQHIQDGDEQYATEPDESDIVFESGKLSLKNDTPDGFKRRKSEQRSTKVFKKYIENPNSQKYSNKRKASHDDGPFVRGELATEYEETVNADMDMNDDGNAYQKHQRKESEQNENQNQNQNQNQNHDHQLQQAKVERQNQKQLPSIVRLNGRKFNKDSRKKVEAERKRIRNKKNSKFTNMRNGQDEKRNIKLNEDGDGDEDEDMEKVEVEIDGGHKEGTVASATIGDIEGKNFRNEDEIVESSKTKVVDNDDDGDDDDEDEDDDGEEDKSVAVTGNSEGSIQPRQTEDQDIASEFIGRKTKRLNRVRTFNSGDSHQVAMQTDGSMYYRPTYQKLLMNENENEKTDKNNHRHQRLESDGTANFQSDYAIESYDTEGPTRNTSNNSEDIQNASGQMQQRQRQREREQQKQHKGNAALTEENANNGEIEAEQATFQQEHGQGRQHQQRQLTRYTSKSAFEQQKARRRNSRLNGHKIHKKRYKDYLRSAMTPKATAPTKMAPLAAKSEQDSTSGKITAAAAAEEDPHSNGTNAAITATLVKLTNKSAENYDRKNVEDEIENTAKNTSPSERHAEKMNKHARKIEAEKSRAMPASPIFVVAANRNSISSVTAASPTKSFYEGQINYFMETKDDEKTGVDNYSNLPAETVNWYRRVSPVLRNGIKTSFFDANEPSIEHIRKHHNQQLHHQHHHHHHQHHHQHAQKIEEVEQNAEEQQQQLLQRQRQYPHQSKPQQNHHQHQHHHHHQQQEHQHRLKHQHHAPDKHEQTNKHYQSAQSNPYQRKQVKKPELTNGISSAFYSTPIPPPSYKPHAGAMQELGHQITEMDALERYYAKWPHLARVQLQVYDEHFRELHPELYPDYDQDYESAAELEEAQNSNAEDANLPPYIKKYNRRNKQLLNLLEGTLASPTIGPYPYGPVQFGSLLQPGPHESNSATVRIDDDYMKAKRRRYHNRYGNNNGHQQNEIRHDLFAEQRNVANANDSLTARQRNFTGFDVVADKPTRTNSTSAAVAAAATTTTTPIYFQNKIPEEDVSKIEQKQDEPDWQEEIETKSNGNDGAKTGNVQMTWQIEKLTAPSTTMTPTKLALFRLPSYSAISGGYIPKPGSQTAQFASSSSERSSSSSSNGYGSGKENAFINMHSDYQNFENTRHMATAISTVAPESQISDSAVNTSPGKTISSFVYHRVVDSAPRFVGAGITGLKQRLPFVAITDRRIETAKKTLMEHKQDLEQNFYPMP